MKAFKLILLPIVIISLSACSSTNPSSSTSTGSSTSTTIDPSIERKIDLFCVNDIHGRVEPEVSGSKYVGGISRLGTYLEKKEATNPSGSLFLNAGDLWQDTFESGKNKGELLTKAMKELSCEAMSLGNHEFDWGIENIKKQKVIAESGDNKFTFLGANIYNYSNGQATSQASDLCAEYKIVKRNDLNIGIIGAIGKGQTSSIVSTIWENHTFVDPVPIVKSLSDDLRTNKGCDVIVYLFHGEASESSYEELSMNSPKTNKPYVNAGFLAHSHAFENVISNGVPWIQSYCHGAVLGHVSLKVQYGNVTCTYYPDYSAEAGYIGRNENGYGRGSSSIYACNDHQGVRAIVNQYLTTSLVEERDKKIVTLNNLSSTSLKDEGGKMLAKATSFVFDELRKKDSSIPTIDVVINNGARDVVYPSNNQLNNGQVFKLVPFTNKTHIASVTGANIYSECVRFGNLYYLPGEKALKLERTKYYNVACIDYLLLHKNEEREYNYFPSYTTSKYILDRHPYEIMNSYFTSNPTFDMSSLSGAAYTGLS